MAEQCLIQDRNVKNWERPLPLKVLMDTQFNELPNYFLYRFAARNTFRGPFSIRSENYKGVVFTTKRLVKSRTYHIEAQATSFSLDGMRIEYQTKFIIYISVADYPF